MLEKGFKNTTTTKTDASNLLRIFSRVLRFGRCYQGGKIIRKWRGRGAKTIITELIYTPDINCNALLKLFADLLNLSLVGITKTLFKSLK